MPQLPSAVLWDMDGTLVDTEPLWMDAQRTLAAEHNMSWTDVDAHSTVGMALPESGRTLQAKGVDLPTETIVDALVQQVASAIGDTVPWMPGALELLSALAEADVPCAIVTMAYAPVARQVASSAPAGSFDLVVAGDDVPRGKPHPDPYLLAAERLGVDAEQCVAIEDSLTGTLSAEAAGMPVIVVPGIADVRAGPRRFFVESLSEVNLEMLRAMRTLRP